MAGTWVGGTQALRQGSSPRLSVQADLSLPGRERPPPFPSCGLRQQLLEVTEGTVTAGDIGPEEPRAAGLAEGILAALASVCFGIVLPPPAGLIRAWRQGALPTLSGGGEGRGCWPPRAGCCPWAPHPPLQSLGGAPLIDICKQIITDFLIYSSGVNGVSPNLYPCPKSQNWECDLTREKGLCTRNWGKELKMGLLGLPEGPEFKDKCPQRRKVAGM